MNGAAAALGPLAMAGAGVAAFSAVQALLDRIPKMAKNFVFNCIPWSARLIERLGRKPSLCILGARNSGIQAVEIIFLINQNTGFRVVSPRLLSGVQVEKVDHPLFFVCLVRYLYSDRH